MQLLTAAMSLVAYFLEHNVHTTVNVDTPDCSFIVSLVRLGPHE